MEKLLNNFYKNNESYVNLVLNNFLGTLKKPVNYYAMFTNNNEANNLSSNILGKLQEINYIIGTGKFRFVYDNYDTNLRHSKARLYGMGIHLRSSNENFKVFERWYPVADNEIAENSYILYSYIYPMVEFIEFYYRHIIKKEFENIKDEEAIKVYSFNEAFNKENENEIFIDNMGTQYKYYKDSLYMNFIDDWTQVTSLNTINNLLKRNYTWLKPNKKDVEE